MNRSRALELAAKLGGRRLVTRLAGDLRVIDAIDGEVLTTRLVIPLDAKAISLVTIETGRQDPHAHERTVKILRALLVPPKLPPTGRH